MTNDEKDKLIKELESMPFDEIREKRDKNGYGPKHGKNYKFVSSWLSRKVASVREEREAESLSISRKALFTSKIANILAASAIIISIIAAIIAYAAYIKSP